MLYEVITGIERALEEITRGRGKQYDPEMVDICLKLFRGGFQFSNV